MKEGTLYQPLLEFLRENNQDELTLTFAEIEALIDSKLPDSARSQRAWWSNRRKGALQASAWMEVGYPVEDVDFERQQVTFRKPIIQPKVPRVSRRGLWNGNLIKALRLHMNLTQTEFAQQLGVRQATVSEWENEVREPSRSTSKHLDLVARMVGLTYREENQNF
ncbi:MAG TPA: transcriptional regulator [Cyanobacteria bacterium UBA11372]|nr:transcriptional regulator [Cyanobacteria bacterium UBA11372]